MYRLFVLAVALNSGVFGLLFLVVPDATLGLFGARLDPLDALVLRTFGGAILGLASFNWLLRDHEGGQVRRAVAVSDIAAYAITSALIAFGSASGLINWLGWLVAAFHGLVAVGLVPTALLTRLPATTAPQ